MTMSLIESFKSLFGARGKSVDGKSVAERPDAAPAAAERVGGEGASTKAASAKSPKDAAKAGDGATPPRARGVIRGKVNIESRFERLRSSVSGTMSNFYVARDRTNGEIVGVKLCDLEKVEFFEARFKGLGKPTEGEIALQMKHPLIVETYEVGVSTKNEPFLVMQYIDGPTLQKVIADRNEQAVAESRLEMIRNMAESILYVHERGFIHRDICPRNFICLPDYSGVRLIDFGLTVPATPPFMAPGNRTGTPLYMSPEIVRRRSTDKRVDIFSFGVSCYSLCTFEFPWQAVLTNGRAALHHDTEPPKDILAYRPNLDPRLAKAIMQAMHPQVDQRTASLDLFLRQIQAVTSATA